MVAPTLLKLFKATFHQNKVPLIWKQSNVTPIFKKGNKSDPNNYRPVSLLCTTEKILEKIVFKYLYNHIRDNSLLSKWQSGFLPGCSTISQLLEIYHQFCQSVDDGKEVRVVFLDISRAFDRVWHAGLLFKLHKYGVRGELLKWISDYLTNRQQRVGLDGQFSNWGDILAGVPQGSILGPLLFLIFINDLTEVVRFTQIRLFADDTCLYITVDNREHTKDLINLDLHAMHEWSEQWLVSFSEPKTKSLIISNKHDRNLNPPLEMNGVLLEEVKSHKHLGVTLSHNLTWSNHIDDTYVKAMKRLDVLLRFKFKLRRRDLERYYISFVLPTIEYGNALWDGASQMYIAKLDNIQIRAMRIITGATERSNIQSLYSDLGWHSLSQRRSIQKLKWFYKINNGLSPDYLVDLVPPTAEERHGYALRRRDNVTPYRTNKQFFSKSFFPSTVREWNVLPIDVREAPSLESFSRHLKQLFPAPRKIPWYGLGDRFLDIHHTRLRLGCSKLKAHLHFNLHVEDNPLCICRHNNETSFHYFFECPLYCRQRVVLFNEVRIITEPSLNLLLYGDESLTLEDNTLVILAVQTYLNDTGRFKNV